MRSLVRPYFEALLLLLLAAGFASLIGTGRLELPVIVFGTVAFVLRAYLVWRAKRLNIPQHWVTVATLLYFVFYLVDVDLISNSFITATVHLVLFVAVVKLFSASQPRDYVYLCVLAFLEMLASATLTVGTGFFVAFLLFLLLTVATFVSFEVFRAEGAASVIARGEEDDFPNQLRTSLFGISLAIAVSVFVAGGLIFFLLPRMSITYWNPGYRESRLTGFSDDVRLGEVGDLQQSDATVMHIRVLDARPPNTINEIPNLRWRGRALSQFDGRSWSNPFRPYVVPTAGGRLEFQPDMAPQSEPRRFVHYRVTLEPIGSEVLFAAPRLVSLWTRYSDVAVDSTSTISSIGRGFSGISYTAASDLSRPTDTDLAAAPDIYPEAIKADYLQLPPGLDPRMPELARKITAGQTTAIGRMRVLEFYLRSHYRYTLKDLPRGDPLADFLFHRRAGHCEYFASALAIMGRIVGVPTRVVNGFITGQYNDISGVYIVRGRDAHSWVEAYFPFESATPPGAQPSGRKKARLARLNRLERAANPLPGDAVWRPHEQSGRPLLSVDAQPQRPTGADPNRAAEPLRRRTWGLSDPETESGTWITFDATAGSPDAVAGAWSRLMLYVDAAQSFWQEWIVNYDFFHQVSLAQRIQGRVLDRADSMRHFLRDLPLRLHYAIHDWWNGTLLGVKTRRTWRWLAVPFAALFAAFLLRRRGLGVLLAHFPRLLSRSSNAAHWRAREAARYYRRLRYFLARAGYSALPAQTAEELLDGLPGENVRGVVGNFVSHYQLARFGNQDSALPLLASDLRHVRRVLKAAH